MRGNEPRTKESVVCSPFPSLHNHGDDTTVYSGMLTVARELTRQLGIMQGYSLVSNDIHV